MLSTVNMRRKPVADTGFEKGGGAFTDNFQINLFWPEFYIKKS